MNNFNDIAAAIAENNKKIEEFNSRFRKEMKNKFNELFKSTFESSPIQAIAWEQYTPYFNDGDECIFNIYDVQFILEGFDPENIENSSYKYEDEDKYTLVNLSDIEIFKNILHKQDLDLNEDSKKYYQNIVNSILEQEEKYPGLSKMCNNISKMITQNKDIMFSIFGDHVSVVVTKDETFINEYDHD